MTAALPSDYSLSAMPEKSSCQRKSCNLLLQSVRCSNVHCPEAAICASKDCTLILAADMKLAQHSHLAISFCCVVYRSNLAPLHTGIN